MDGILHLKNTGRKDYFYEEAIKTLRTNIQFCGSGLKTIMFTSSMPDEGKSETAFALASSFGNIGKKVLLVDADIRKSVMVKRYEIKGNPNGLSQYLSGQKSLRRYAIRRTWRTWIWFSPVPFPLIRLNCWRMNCLRQ